MKDMHRGRGSFGKVPTHEKAADGTSTSQVKGVVEPLFATLQVLLKDVLASVGAMKRVLRLIATFQLQSAASESDLESESELSSKSMTRRLPRQLTQPRGWPLAVEMHVLNVSRAIFNALGVLCDSVFRSS